MQPIPFKPRMRPRADAPPGMETDGRGNVIPLFERTPEDQQKAAGQALPPPDMTP